MIEVIFNEALFSRSLKEGRLRLEACGQEPEVPRCRPEAQGQTDVAQTEPSVAG